MYSNGFRKVKNNNGKFNLVLKSIDNKYSVNGKIFVEDEESTEIERKYDKDTIIATAMKQFVPDTKILEYCIVNNKLHMVIGEEIPFIYIMKFGDDDASLNGVVQLIGMLNVVPIDDAISNG